MESERSLFLPSVQSWASALLLHLFYRLYAAAMGVVILMLLELMRVSPRLAVLGGLAAWLSPIPLVALGHRVVSAFLGRADPSNKDAGKMSAWAGLYAWLVIWLSSSVTVFVLLLINPPKPEPEQMVNALAGLSGGAAIVSVQTVVWIVVAAVLYEAARRMKKIVSAGAG
jgi:hypothetical protein